VQTGQGPPCVVSFARTIGLVSLTIARWPLQREQLPRGGPTPYTTRWDATDRGDQPKSVHCAELLQRCRLPHQPASASALAITDEASPLALRSTRNRLRSHGRWPPRRMSMATPGQARRSLVRASPCLRLMRGPSRHHDLVAASTPVSIVSSVGPAGRHQHRRSGMEVAGGRGCSWNGPRRPRSARTRWGLPSASLTLPAPVGVAGVAARRSAPTRGSPRAWRRWPTGCRPRASGRW
jgi:hypothetical protein